MEDYDRLFYQKALMFILYSCMIGTGLFIVWLLFMIKKG